MWPIGPQNLKVIHGKNYNILLTNTQEPITAVLAVSADLRQKNNHSCGAGIVMQQVKLPLATPASHTGTPIQVPVAQLPVHFVANMLRKAAEAGPGTRASAIPKEDVSRVLGSWF